MKILVCVILLLSLFAILNGCSPQGMSDFSEGFVGTGIAATDSILDAEIESQKRQLAIQAERDRKLAQRNAVVESRLRELGTPQHVATKSIGGQMTVLYTYDSKTTIKHVISVLGTPDDVRKQDKMTLYVYGHYVVNDVLGFVMIAKPLIN